jgi:hypothetical protein
MTATTTVPTDFINYLLAEMRCASLRTRILQADIEAIGLALKGGLISADQALVCSMIVTYCASSACRRRPAHHDDDE